MFAQTTLDPLSIGVGARALGMGKAFVAVAEDGDTIFTNPAGLGEIDSFNFTSMSARILEDVNYTMLGGVYPLGARTAWGLGYISTDVSGIDVRDSRNNLTTQANYKNSVIFASFGRKLTAKFSLGLNIKYFIQDATENNNGDGSGVNLDVGILQQGLGWLSLGLVGQNILSSGKVKYQSDTEDNLPSTLKLGARMQLLGQNMQAARLAPINLVAVVDADLNLARPSSTPLHIGAELSPNRMLTLRAGIDQDAKPNGIQSNFTSGVSLRIAGLGFHYAYHPYFSVAEATTHYFSISFDERGWPVDSPPDTFLGSR
ncbi:MAG: PorV/PorQ family protein [bacterium]